MPSYALFGVRRFLRGLGVALPRGALWFVLVGVVALAAAMIIIWAVGKRKHAPF